MLITLKIVCETTKKDKHSEFPRFFFFLGTSIVVSGKSYNQSELPFFSPEEENQIIF